jgi:hypothetical protein
MPISNDQQYSATLRGEVGGYLRIAFPVDDVSLSDRETIMRAMALFGYSFSYVNNDTDRDSQFIFYIPLTEQEDE